MRTDSTALLAIARPIADNGVAGLQDLYRTRRAKPSQIVDGYLARIARENAALGVFVVVDGRGARRAARVSDLRWARGKPLSPLDGVPIAVAADIAVCGLPCAAGAASTHARFAPADAPGITRLRAAGAVLLGLLVPGDTACASPAAIAAVAAGLCAAALGMAGGFNAIGRCGDDARAVLDVVAAQ